MHTGVISFCDRISYNIKSSDTKDAILIELERKFQIIILQKHWHRLDDNSVQYLQRVPHLACLRSNGNPYYMYFTKYEDVPIIYFIDKKVQPGYQKPRIILCRGQWSPDIFADTLIEGEMVKDFDGKWLFLINDVLGFRGKYLANETLPQRIEHAFDILANMYIPNEVMDVCRYQVKKFAHATQEGTDALIELSKDLNYTSRGIYYCPFSCKYKPKLVNFDDSLIKSVIRKVKDTPDFREAPAAAPARPQSPPQPKAQVAEAVPPPSPPMQAPAQKEAAANVLWLRKTENPDVYDVYTQNNGMTNNSKVGIASVQSMQTSKMLRAIFKDTTVAVYVPFTCKFNDETNKWVPLSRYVESS